MAEALHNVSVQLVTMGCAQYLRVLYVLLLELLEVQQMVHAGVVAEALVMHPVQLLHAYSRRMAKYLLLELHLEHHARYDNLNLFMIVSVSTNFYLIHHMALSLSKKAKNLNIKIYTPLYLITLLFIVFIATTKERGCFNP